MVKVDYIHLIGCDYNISLPTAWFALCDHFFVLFLLSSVLCSMQYAWDHFNQYRTSKVMENFDLRKFWLNSEVKFQAEIFSTQNFQLRFQAENFD